MPEKLYSLTVRGKRKTWSFTVPVDPQHIPEWRADGIEIDELENIIPEWYVNAGLPIRAWCFVQDLLYFKNPFS